MKQKKSKAVVQAKDCLKYKVGFLGVPDSIMDGETPPERKKGWHTQVPWTRENLSKLRKLGFNTVQINVAWGSRPGDEALNIEDVVELPAKLARKFPQSVPLRCNPSPQRRRERRADLQARIGLCRELGLRTLFHFGAPYNAHERYGDGPPNCLLDGETARRYEHLLQVFAREFPGVDDIQLYTYDQDAWLCGEFGPCPRCLGIPLHERLVPFLDRMADAWRKARPQGRLWWEPWELSAGQVLCCVQQVNPHGFGLALHVNIAEVQATLPVDRWLRNTCQLAHQRGIPALIEYFLGGSSEELEPLAHLAHPLVTFRGLQRISELPGIAGIKEYYGLNPTIEDPNLRITGLFFANPAATEEQALQTLARPYGRAAKRIAEFWRLTSKGMELFPWETSWHIREFGRSNPAHSLSAAMLRGQQAHTPSWESTRHAIFMKTDDLQPDPWMFEDVQLRCHLAAEAWQQAQTLGRKLLPTVPANLSGGFRKNLEDLTKARSRALAYAYHLRETNLVGILRQALQKGETPPRRIVEDLEDTMKVDLKNLKGAWPEMKAALALLRRDLPQFLETFFLEEPNRASKGGFSVTSR
jgi:hypothetical protein